MLEMVADQANSILLFISLTWYTQNDTEHFKDFNKVYPLKNVESQSNQLTRSKELQYTLSGVLNNRFKMEIGNGALKPNLIPH